MLLFITYNEEENIRNYLESVKLVKDIIICDIYSEDRTVEITKKYTDKIFYFERVGYVEPAREFAVSQANHEWILIIDADKLIPYKMFLKIKIQKDICDVFLVITTFSTN